MSPIRLPFALLFVPLASCTGTDDDSADDDTVVADDDDDDDDDTSGDDDDSSPAFSTAVQGIVQNAGGEPLSGLPIALCHEICLTATTGPDGAFSFAGMEPMSYVVENLGTPEGDVAHWGKFFDVANVVEDAPIDFGVKVVPRVADPHEGLTGAQVLDFPDVGMEVRFDADAVELPPVAKALSFGLVAVPESQWPQGGLPEGWTPVLAAAAAVWDLHAVDGFVVTATLPTALPTGTPVAFFVADYDATRISGSLVQEDAVLSEDGAIVRTADGGGLDRSTLWIVAAQLPAGG